MLSRRLGFGSPSRVVEDLYRHISGSYAKRHVVQSGASLDANSRRPFRPRGRPGCQVVADRRENKQWDRERQREDQPWARERKAKLALEATGGVKSLQMRSLLTHRLSPTQASCGQSGKERIGLVPEAEREPAKQDTYHVAGRGAHNSGTELYARVGVKPVSPQPGVDSQPTASRRSEVLEVFQVDV